ncbi:hypothetical protein BI308_06070 [Roseofilum reptotaenium AO1-A]|uniref:Uncharacterized protein n=2 Tax=Roseofilum TaxID=1233426 RepID=A0A1L9QUU9_9CYAN|nr:hypothetical protein BI308_06070 [Roseofilum reptotaenium AO1-A]
MSIAERNRMIIASLIDETYNCDYNSPIQRFMYSILEQMTVVRVDSRGGKYSFSGDLSLFFADMDNHIYEMKMTVYHHLVTLSYFGKGSFFGGIDPVENLFIGELHFSSVYGKNSKFLGHSPLILAGETDQQKNKCITLYETEDVSNWQWSNIFAIAKQSRKKLENKSYDN